MEPFGERGWTVREFSDAGEAAAWWLANQQAAMPCWRRMEVVSGVLVVVR